MLPPLPGSTNGQEGCSWATTCCLAREEEGSDPVNSPPLRTQRLRKPLLSEVLGTAGFRANGGTKTRYSTRPFSGEGEVQLPSPNEQSPPSLGRPSQGLLHLRLPPGLAGAWTGWASCLRPALRRCLGKGCCGSVGAKAAAGGAHGDEQAEGLQPGWKQQVSSGA